MPSSGVIVPGAAALAAALLAWWPWRGRLDAWPARVGALARGAAIFALLLLVLDPGIRGTVARQAPLVLLDNSVSMHAAGAAGDSAVALAERLGRVTRFGELAPGEPGSGADLERVLADLVAQGRPLTVVTDGEVAEAGALPADLLAQATVVTLPRPRGGDVAITEVRMPSRLAVGDTLAVEVALLATGGWDDTVTVEVRSGDRVLLSGRAAFIAPDGRAILRLAGQVPDDLTGDRWLEIALADHADLEPGDDLRWRHLRLTPSPGIVVLAEVPDWDARFLHTALREVADAPVEGFIQLTPGLWRRMGDLTPVSLDVVTRAARGADLLAVRGDTTAWRQVGRARLLWPATGTEGDWYLASAGLSPVAAAFAGVDVDSLPPLPEAAALPAGDWVGVSARQARRGDDLPVMAGTVAGGRTVRLTAQGLYRWAFRGGVAEQAWRAMIAQAATWLLDAPAEAGAPARPVEVVTQRGRPVRFRSDRPGTAELPIEVTSADLSRTDTLRFDAGGEARLPLPPGRYRYRFAGQDAGVLAVEPYSDELVPSPVRLEAREAQVAPTAPRRSLRELLPLFLLAIAGFATEWILRRRVGLR